MVPQKNNIKAIAIDLDGTTLGDGAILSERTRRALAGCAAKNIRVIIATGRSVKSAEPYRAAIGAEGPMVYYNGAMTLDMPSRSILDEHFIGQDVVSCCADIARSENTHFHIFTCGNSGGFSETLIAERPSAATEVYSNRTGLDFSYGNLYNALPKDEKDDSARCVKGIFIDSEPKLRRIQQLTRERLGGKVNTMLSTDFILEILAGGVTKTSGLRMALAFYGFSMAEVIAFGDEENDIPMLAAAGYSVAPANARKSALETAKLIIGPNTEDSVAEFLEKNLLNS
jgi:Cof subfamily protein (haloacid dehalogenase superfamily)